MLVHITCQRVTLGEGPSGVNQAHKGLLFGRLAVFEALAFNGNADEVVTIAVQNKQYVLNKSTSGAKKQISPSILIALPGRSQHFQHNSRLTFIQT